MSKLDGIPFGDWQHCVREFRALMVVHAIGCAVPDTSRVALAGLRGPLVSDGISIGFNRQAEIMNDQLPPSILLPPAKSVAVSQASIRGNSLDKIWLKEYPQGIPAEVDIHEYSSLRDIFEKSCRTFGHSPPTAICPWR